MGANKRRGVPIWRVSGGAARCGKLRQIISAPQDGYISAKLVLAAELMFETLCMGTTVLAGPHPIGDSVLGGHKGVGSPLGEIHGVPREPTLPI
jgi:hypothetical protein